MNWEVAEDGLTVTDTAWDAYKIEGYDKRWTVNMGAPMTEPLKGFKFRPEISGLPVNVTVELFNPAKPWEVKESYQEILLLGGKQRIGLPEWSTSPPIDLGTTSMKATDSPRVGPCREASMPYQTVQQVAIRRPGRAEEYGFELVGDFPIIKRLPIKEP